MAASLKRKEATSGDESRNKKMQADDEAQPAGATAMAGAGKKRKKLVKTRLPRELLDEIVRRPVTPFPVIPDELLAAFSEECRAAFATQKADIHELMALDADIIKQYKDKGYAEVEEEATDDDEPGSGKKRKKPVKTRLPQELVDEILNRPVTPFPVIPVELLAGFSEQCRAALAAQKADAEELMALDADIIGQYKDKGYAEVEEEATDDEEDQKVED